MNHVDQQYNELIKNILENGVDTSTRQGGTCRKIFGHMMKFDLSEGFPILTSRKIYWQTALKELLVYLSGADDLKSMLDMGVNAWTDDAYSKYHEFASKMNHEIIYSKKVFEKAIKEDSGFVEMYGNKLYPYGRNFRRWQNRIDIGEGKETIGQEIDQINNTLKSISENPFSRRHIISGWDASTVNEYYMPQCWGLLNQFHVEPMKCDRCKETGTVYHYAEVKQNERLEILDEPVCPDCEGKDIEKYKLHLSTYQRSADVFLGLAFNISQCGFLLHMFCYLLNMVLGTINYHLGDAHLYEEHLEPAKELLEREIHKLPKLKVPRVQICKTIPEIPYKAVKIIESIDDFKPEDFELINYKHSGELKGELIT